MHICDWFKTEIRLESLKQTIRSFCLTFSNYCSSSFDRRILLSTTKNWRRLWHSKVLSISGLLQFRWLNSALHPIELKICIWCILDLKWTNMMWEDDYLNFRKFYWRNTKERSELKPTNPKSVQLGFYLTKTQPKPKSKPQNKWNECSIVSCDNCWFLQSKRILTSIFVHLGSITSRIQMFQLNRM